MEGSVKTLFVIGTKDQSDREFAPPGSNLYFHVGKDPVSRFPKELNILPYPMEYLYFNLGRAEAATGLTLTLDPVWSNGSGVLYVGAVVINPRQHVVTVYRSLTDITILTEEDILDGGQIVPGWTLPVREVFV